jgi:hypothetical protein
MEDYPKSIKSGEMIPVAFISMYNPALAWKVVSSNQYLGQFLSDVPQPKSKIAFVAKFEYGNLEYFSGGGFSAKTSELITSTNHRDNKNYDFVKTKDVQRSKQTPGLPPVTPVSQPVTQPVSQPVSQPVTQPVSQPVSQPMPDSTDASNLRISKLEDELKNAKRTIEILNNMLSKRGIPQSNNVTQGGKTKRKTKKKVHKK